MRGGLWAEPETGAAPWDAGFELGVGGSMVVVVYVVGGGREADIGPAKSNESSMA